MADSDGTNPLGVVDFLVFSSFLAVAAGTGLYYGIAKGGQQTTNQYLLAERKMNFLPIAMTLLVSFLSPVTLLGLPAEVYKNGAYPLNFVFAKIPIFVTMAFIFIPVYYGLGITSVYEYLSRRFNFVLRIVGALIFMFQTLLYISIVTYAPALAIEAVNGFAMWKTILITGSVCTFYSALGGMKAVIWTDVFMFVVIEITIILILVMGSIESGGIANVLRINKDAGRLDIFSFPLDVTERITTPSGFFGPLFNTLAQWSVSQTGVQRFLAAKSQKQAQTSALINIPLTTVAGIVSVFEGLVMFAFYSGSLQTLSGNGTYIPDANSNHSIIYHAPPNVTSNDQILIYRVSQQFGHIPGYQGLFIACIFAGSLSTVSSGLNSLTAVTLVDIIKPWRHWRARRSYSPDTRQHEGRNDEEQDKRDTKLTKVLTVVYGIVCIGLAFLASKLGSLFSMTIAIFGALGGPLLGTFLLGMLYKRANSRGALAAAIAGASFRLWMVIGRFIHLNNLDEAFPLYRVSFLWYSTFTLLVTLSVGITASEIIRLLFPGERTKTVDDLLLVTFLRKGSPPNSNIISNDVEIELLPGPPGVINIKKAE
ncbi:sodium-coupled monocarboxylate transporter 1-like [Amphiura filiformis]|uniref:sodium-coupled monocarboxylate transporter 1-like n=1 Tax=Amphiura filiformis TaxID=82378 RepID=UPI003B215C58